MLNCQRQHDLVVLPNQERPELDWLPDRPREINCDT